MGNTPADQGIAAAKRDDQSRDKAAETFTYLDGLRESGVTNMYGAGSYLQDEFSFTKDVAKKVLTAWMFTFSSELTPRERAATAAEQDKLPDLADYI